MSVQGSVDGPMGGEKMGGFGGIIWLLIIGGLFFWMMRKGGCCGGGHSHGAGSKDSGPSGGHAHGGAGEEEVKKESCH